MEMKFWLRSMTPSVAGKVSLRLLPVEGAPENDEFMDEATGEIILDHIKAETVADFYVPTEDERTGYMNNPNSAPGQPPRIPSGKPIIPYQKFTVVITKD